jgi:hypothetical protein
MSGPFCCGKEAEWVVQSKSLSYWFCRQCKNEVNPTDCKHNFWVYEYPVKCYDCGYTLTRREYDEMMARRESEDEEYRGVPWDP